MYKRQLWKEKREEKPKQNQSELKRCQKRYDELSALIRSPVSYTHLAKEAESEKPSAFVISEDEIDRMLRTGSNFEGGKIRI